MLRCYYN